jgi:hypothetical protein
VEGITKGSSLTPRLPLFNSDVETGIRALIVLDALHPRECNIAELTWFDYVIVNTGQFEHGPPSIHPATAIVTGELLVRRHSIQRGLQMMQLLHLVQEAHGESGITYLAGEEAPLFIDRLVTSYHLQLKSRASWLASTFGDKRSDQIEAAIEAAIGRWTAHMQTDAFPTGMQP